MESDQPPLDATSSTGASAALTAAANEAHNDRGQSLARLVEAQYPRLRELALRLASAERAGTTLNATALLHEAYLRLIDQHKITEQGTTFFRACFARECRNILVDRARARGAQRRGGGQQPQTLVENRELSDNHGLDLLVLHEAIESLARVSERMARIVDLRIFGGLTVLQCAEVLGVSSRTVDQEWRLAKSWLRKEVR